MCGLTMKLSHFWNIKKSPCDSCGPSGAVGQQMVVYLDTCRKSCKEGPNQLCSGSVSCFSAAAAASGDQVPLTNLPHKGTNLKTQFPVYTQTYSKHIRNRPHVCGLGLKGLEVLS